MFLLLSGFGGPCLSWCSLEFGGLCVLVMGFLDVLSSMVYGCGYIGCCGALWNLVGNMCTSQGNLEFYGWFVLGVDFLVVFVVLFGCVCLNSHGALWNLVGGMSSLCGFLEFGGCFMLAMGFLYLVSNMVIGRGFLRDHGVL